MTARYSKAVLQENGNEILSTKNGEKEFTTETINEIRKNIIKYHRMFEALSKKIF